MKENLKNKIDSLVASNVLYSGEKFYITPDMTLHINGGVKEIRADDLKNIDFGLKWQIQNIVLPNSLKSIGNRAFSGYANVESIALPISIESLGFRSFAGCLNLKNINIPYKISEIPEECFDTCQSLTNIEMSNCLLNSIGKHAFRGCSALEKFTCPDSLAVLEDGVFKDCSSLKELHLNDNLKLMMRGNLDGTQVRELYLPDSMFAFDNGGVPLPPLDKISFSPRFTIHANIYEMGLDAVKTLEVRYKDKIITLKLDEVSHDDFRVLATGRKKGFSYYYKGKVYLAGKENELIVLTCDEIRKHITKQNELNKLGDKFYPYLPDWFAGHKFVPHYTVVEGMPREEIPLFYKDNNAKNWSEIYLLAGMKTDEGKGSLFGLAHALGVFSPDGKESKRATEFIKKYVLKEYTENQIHMMFNFDSAKTPYNPEFAKFFMLYFPDDPQFLIYEGLDWRDRVDLLNAVHDTFTEIQKAFPNKKVITRQDNDRLTPEIVVNFKVGTDYENINDQNRDLSTLMAKFGYSQLAFDKVSEWFKKGCALTPDKITLRIARDPLNESFIMHNTMHSTAQNTENSAQNGENSTNLENSQQISASCSNTQQKQADSTSVLHKPTKKDIFDIISNAAVPVRYEFLEKTDPLGAVLGDITNCCQRFGSSGEKCVEYGMSRGNSGFVIFSKGEHVLGQAWIWYDEQAKQVTLDNIEVPSSVLNIVKDYECLQHEIVECLERLGQGILDEMNKDKFKVSCVTIGLGYNDFNKFLNERYIEVENPTTLSDYLGYTDAKRQYLLAKSEKMHTFNKEQGETTQNNKKEQENTKINKKEHETTMLN